MTESEGFGVSDEREDRAAIDRYGFLFFATAGSIAILIAKFFEAPTWLIATGAGIVMLGYAIMVQKRGSAKLRSDQAGDNCYYLGLVYTLTSLAFAIFTFDPADTATTIVQGFGIALATTIFGLILRVFFAQTRVDLYENEEQVRIELAEAAGKLRGQLTNLNLEFKSFTTGLQQSVIELTEEALESIKATSKRADDAVVELSEEASKNIRKHSAELSNSSGDLAKKVGSVSRSIERNGQAIDSVSNTHEIILSDISKMAEATTAMLENSKAVVEQCNSIKTVQEGTAETASSLDKAVVRLGDDLLSNLEQSATRMEAIARDLAQRLKDLEEGPGDVAERAIGAIRKAAQAAEADISKLSEAQVAALAAIGSSTEQLVGTVSEHNTSLEAELAKSRGNVVKVHDGLVDMTTKLNEALKPDE